MKRFYALIRKLRKAYPQFTVQVRRKPQADFGHTWQLDEDQRFRITIRKDLNEDAAIDTLIHEWAHSLAWNYMLEKAALELTQGQIDQAEFEDRAHGPEFGVAFATVWRVFVRNILPVLRSQ